MKKISFLALIFFNFNATSQVIKKGDIMLDVYHGSRDYLDLYYRNFVPTYRNTINDELKFSTIKRVGPIGLRGEYLLLNKIGVGFNICFDSYSRTSINLQDDAYFHEYKESNIAFLPTFNYHLIQKEKLDLYFTIGAGVKYIQQKAFHTNPLLSSGRKNYCSTDMSFGFGMRYFITKHIGLSTNIQLGVGGLFSGGISYKF